MGLLDKKETQSSESLLERDMGILKKPLCDKDFELFGQWAMVAFSAMCARRVQPIFTLAAGDLLKEYIQFLDDSITFAEEFSATGKLPDIDLDKVIEIVGNHLNSLVAQALPLEPQVLANVYVELS